jgi:hypothetical protein
MSLCICYNQWRHQSTSQTSDITLWLVKPETVKDRKKSITTAVSKKCAFKNQQLSVTSQFKKTATVTSHKVEPTNPRRHTVEKTKEKKSVKMSSKESTTTNSSDGAGTSHHSGHSSVPRSVRSATLPPSDRNPLYRLRKTSIPISHSSSIRSRSSGGSSLGSSQSQRPVTVTYKTKTTSGMLFQKKTTSVNDGVYLKETG